MRICATADLHFNHPRSRALAEDLLAHINTLSFDVLLLIGDTASSEGDHLERCLELVRFPGPKLFIAGNHELWSRDADTHELFTQTLPQRITACGWHWLEGNPYHIADHAFVGTVGWYDYQFAPPHLGIPQRFYRAKVSPGAAARLSEHTPLVEGHDDIRPEHLEIVARWNDGRYVRLGRSDEQFLHERLADLETSLNRAAHARHIIAAVHHLPFRELLPPPRNPSWDFAWAYLGSPAIGELLLRYKNLSHVLCGHSHLPEDRQIAQTRVINIGSGYRQKHYILLQTSP